MFESWFFDATSVGSSHDVCLECSYTEEWLTRVLPHTSVLDECTKDLPWMKPLHWLLKHVVLTYLSCAQIMRNKVVLHLFVPG